MRSLEWWLPVVTAVVVSVLPTATHAQTSAAIQKYLHQQARGCSLYAYQENFRGKLPGAEMPVTIATYTLESCSGGNDAVRTVGVFYEANGAVHQLKRPARPIDGPDVEDSAGVTIQGDRITIRFSDYAPTDPRCCPSLKRTRSYKLLNGAIVPG
jgi:hypothetical protein